MVGVINIEFVAKKVQFGVQRNTTHAIKVFSGFKLEDWGKFTQIVYFSDLGNFC